MESLKKLETFEEFKARVVSMFQIEGYSQRVQAEITKWHDRKNEMISEADATAENMGRFNLELAKIYVGVEQKDTAIVILKRAGDSLDRELNELAETYDNDMRAQGLEPEKTIPDPYYRRLVDLFDEIEAFEKTIK